jgi:hypothetical protein
LTKDQLNWLAAELTDIRELLSALGIFAAASFITLFIHVMRHWGIAKEEYPETDEEKYYGKDDHDTGEHHDG